MPWFAPTDAALTTSSVPVPSPKYCPLDTIGNNLPSVTAASPLPVPFVQRTENRLPTAGRSVPVDVEVEVVGDEVEVEVDDVGSDVEVEVEVDDMGSDVEVVVVVEPEIVEVDVVGSKVDVVDVDPVELDAVDVEDVDDEVDVPDEVVVVDVEVVEVDVVGDVVDVVSTVGEVAGTAVVAVVSSTTVMLTLTRRLPDCAVMLALPGRTA